MGDGNNAAIPAEARPLFELAARVRENSYSPYSLAKVGAAIRVKSGQVFAGCNVENSSFGATSCAERSAIQRAVSDLGRIEITEVFVVTDADPPWPPCGICRQVVAEFGAGARIHLANPRGGQYVSYRLEELLPHAFTPADMK